MDKVCYLFLLFSLFSQFDTSKAMTKLWENLNGAINVSFSGLLRFYFPYFFCLQLNCNFVSPSLFLVIL